MPGFKKQPESPFCLMTQSFQEQG